MLIAGTGTPPPCPLHPQKTNGGQKKKKSGEFDYQCAETFGITQTQTKVTLC